MSGDPAAAADRGDGPAVVAALALEGVGVRLGGRWIVRDASMSVGAGEAVALVGENGAGKSTLLGAVAGVVRCDRGVMTLGGRTLAGPVRRRVGFVPEAADPPGHLTAEELLALTAALKHAPVPGDTARRRFYPAPLDCARVDTLSLGERRRVCLAAALIGQPALLVLDEPDGGLDAGGLADLAAILGEEVARGAAVLLATHDRELVAALGARIVTVQDGRLG